MEHRETLIRDVSDCLRIDSVTEKEADEELSKTKLLNATVPAQRQLSWLMFRNARGKGFNLFVSCQRKHLRQEKSCAPFFRCWEPLVIVFL